MLSLRFGHDGPGPLRVLCLGAHSDDLEIGCGGTLLRLIDSHPDLVVRWVVFSADPVREAEARASAQDFLQSVADRDIRIRNHKDGCFPFYGEQIREDFESLKGFDPAVILTHYREDLHQDHRLIAELTYRTFRNHLILEYEIPKFDGDLGNPNVFVSLPRAVCERKVAAILRHFESQRKRAWFSAETFMAIMRLRGVGVAAPDGYAEGLYCRKMMML